MSPHCFPRGRLVSSAPGELPKSMGVVVEIPSIVAMVFFLSVLSSAAWLGYLRVRFGKHGHSLRGRLLAQGPEVDLLARFEFQLSISVARSSNKKRPIVLLRRQGHQVTPGRLLRFGPGLPRSFAVALSLNEAQHLDELLGRGLELVETATGITEVGRFPESARFPRVQVHVDPSLAAIQFRAGGSGGTFTVASCRKFRAQIEREVALAAT